MENALLFMLLLSAVSVPFVYLVGRKSAKAAAVANRFVVYPLLLWMLGFGAYLIGDSNDKK